MKRVLRSGNHGSWRSGLRTGWGRPAQAHQWRNSAGSCGSRKGRCTAGGRGTAAWACLCCGSSGHCGTKTVCGSGWWRTRAWTRRSCWGRSEDHGEPGEAASGRGQSTTGAPSHRASGAPGGGYRAAPGPHAEHEGTSGSAQEADPGKMSTANVSELSTGHWSGCSSVLRCSPSRRIVDPRRRRQAVRTDSVSAT